MSTTNCFAGFARLDITGPLGVRIGGYYTPRVTKGVLDPLYVRATAFREGEKTAILLVCDLLGMYGPAAYEWPPKIAKKLGLPTEAVFLSHTHTHTSPVVNSFREPYDEQYDAWLFRRLCDAARMAIDDLKIVTDVRAAETMTENIAYVRRYYMQDGTLRTNPRNYTPEEVAAIKEPAHDTDGSLRLVRILREDAPELIFINYQMHPDNIGGEFLSADYPGALCRRVEELAPNSHAIFMNGAEGQMVAGTRLQLAQKRNAYEYTMQLGVTLADKAMELYDSAPSTGMSGLLNAQRLLHAQTKLDPDKLDQCKEIVALFEAGKNDGGITPGYDYTAPESYGILDMAKKGQFYLDLPVTAIVFCGVAFLGLPGEPFCELGIDIRNNSKFPMTFIACQTNGNHGYYPISRAFDEGGYEPHNTRLRQGIGEELVETANALLASM